MLKPSPRLIPCLMIIASFWSCGRNKEVTGNNEHIPHEGTIVSETITGYPDEGYCIWLPPDYSAEKLYPLLLCFDPQGRGDIPVNLFSETITGNDFIIVGSNTLRNGINEPMLHLQRLFMDVKNKYPVQKENLFATGFSGGASIAIAAAKQYGCKAIITSGNPSNLDKSSFPTCNITGLFDFNYMNLIIPAFSSFPDNQLIVAFDGAHQWPDEEAIRTSAHFLCYLAGSDKDAYIDFLTKLADQYLTKGWYCEAAFLLSGTNQLPGFSGNNPLKKVLQDLMENPAFAKDMKLMKENLSLEQKIRSAYVEAFGNKDSTWWKNEYYTLIGKISNEKNQRRKEMYTRVKNFLSVLGYVYSDAAINKNQMQEAKHFLAIYTIVDPDNPDVMYLKARILSDEGSYDEAASTLTEAITEKFYQTKAIKKDFPVEVTENEKMIHQLEKNEQPCN